MVARISSSPSGLNLAGPVSTEGPRLGVAARTWNRLPASLQGKCAGPQTDNILTKDDPQGDPTGELLSLTPLPDPAGKGQKGIHS